MSVIHPKTTLTEMLSGQETGPITTNSKGFAVLQGLVIPAPKKEKEVVITTYRDPFHIEMDRMGVKPLGGKAPLTQKQKNKIRRKILGENKA